MHWTRWIVAALVFVNPGWMLFDGARALVVGDYVTPRSGAHAGQLGPWARLVRAAGIEPRSTLMKAIFVGYGAASLAITGVFLAQVSWAWTGMVAMAILGLWYVPFGTLIDIVVLVLLWFLPHRGPAR